MNLDFLDVETHFEIEVRGDIDLQASQGRMRLYFA
jgi:hypothetical protein